MNYSVFNLPLNEQNTIKWLTIFPLAILVIVLIRNVVGIVTMGTFTPMLISLALVKTGLIPGLVCFSIILSVGLVLRAVLSRLNLLFSPANFCCCYFCYSDDAVNDNSRIPL